jgi:uncharacterized alkaline shock family protein YloU
MTDYSRPPGKTTIDPNVLLSIARLTTLSVPGVKRLGQQNPGVNQWFRKADTEGVDISIKNNQVFTDIYVILSGDVNVREVSREIQAQVSRSISEMVGMEVGRVNVHIEDIDYSASPQP